MRAIIAQVQTRVDLVGRRALLAGAFLGRGFGISQRWSEAAAEAAADAKRKAGIFGDDSADRDVSVSCECGKHGDHLGHGEVLADAAPGAESERQERPVLVLGGGVVSRGFESQGIIPGALVAVNAP